jgi:DNA (cytosine-5)-methyltransferase 1
MGISVADLFCGTGGFSHGFMQAGSFDVVLGVEIRKASIDTFSANHKHALTICDDIRNVRVKDVAERLGKGTQSIDVVIGGPPCQGFSSIRPFRSINEDDRRNTLFEQFTLFVDFFRPKFVVFENVVGLRNHKEGKVLWQIESAVQQLGYATSVGILNAMNYGVPQKRERVIIIWEARETQTLLAGAKPFG